ncbi:N-methylhydantoinase A [Spinactinospora alkalitolerans]|uniref:N-methylhydantoinase A n=1 Tax=Spinactinospora alkalitolerans TaxID=687207 RepID=A0A852TP31_9ACTN|nr:hydantoinase/oxoprolinase family protein [Spinactinospora alkalitolerans]NYE46116.1 N-methylhydantoinase A [Spinactinospora alkalitolerans]
MTGQRSARRVRIGIDTGGTFTDVVALDEDTGELVTTKTPSTPADPADGFMDGVTKVVGLLGGAVEIGSISHGTTVATNQLLEDRIDRLGFITTEGYEFVLEIARQAVPDGYGNSYFWVKPDRIVPVDLVRTVGGRLDHTGAEIRPLDEQQAAEAARWFRDQGVDTIGVCLLHSYADPGHERRVRDILRAEHPGAVVSISSEVLREYREYERSMTTLVDAAVKPRVARYVSGIRDRIDASGTAGDGRRLPFHIMKSNGGVLSAEEVVHQPITTVLSGPAAGALGAAFIARHAGFDRVLTLDGGGTSTDVSVVVDGEPSLTTEGSIGRFPSKIPMIDIVTVGAGGGSVAWISPEGTLKVGPRSAGADPGPICYGNGGTEPTITDAHAMLGRIPPHLLGGEIPLDVAAAREGITKVADQLSLGPEQAATGILEISAWNQANALRQITVQRGLDVRDFHMATFGGSGSLLLCRLIDILGLAGVIVPRDPGNVSAFGLLTVDVKNDYVQTAVARHADLDLDRLAGIYAALAGRAAEALDSEGFARAEHRYDRTADLRYFGQAYEVRVPVPDGPVDADLAERVAGAFHDAHLRLYGYDFRDDPNQQVEWVNLRVSGVGPIRSPLPQEPTARDGDASRALAGEREVYFDDAGIPAGHRTTPVYRRRDLAPGDRITGPAVIEEFGSTVPIHPGFAARIDRSGNIVVTTGTARER